jgi:hypothetical protein
METEAEAEAEAEAEEDEGEDKVENCFLHREFAHSTRALMCLRNDAY